MKTALNVTFSASTFQLAARLGVAVLQFLVLLALTAQQGPTSSASLFVGMAAARGVDPLIAFGGHEVHFRAAARRGLFPRPELKMYAARGGIVCLVALVGAAVGDLPAQLLFGVALGAPLSLVRSIAEFGKGIGRPLWSPLLEHGVPFLVIGTGILFCFVSGLQARSPLFWPMIWCIGIFVSLAISLGLVGTARFSTERDREYRERASLLMVGLVGAGLAQGPVLLAGLLGSDGTTSTIGLIQRVCAVFPMALTSVSAVYGPEFLRPGNASKALSSARKQCQLLAIISLCFVVPALIVTYVYSPGLDNFVPLAVMFVASQIVNLAVGPTTEFLNWSGGSRLELRSQSIGLAGTVGMSVALSGGLGAALAIGISWTVSTLVRNGLSVRFLKRELEYCDD